MTTEKLMETIRDAVVPRGYRMKSTDIFTIQAEAEGNVIQGSILTFNYGFIQGQKAAKAEASRKKKQLMERDPSGWYGYLSRWLERNIGNEKLLQKLSTWARILEDLFKEREQ